MAQLDVYDSEMAISDEDWDAENDIIMTRFAEDTKVESDVEEDDEEDDTSSTETRLG